jgi:hypothetical protein
MSFRSSNREQTRIIDTVLAVPAERLEPRGHTQFTFPHRRQQPLHPRRNRKPALSLPRNRKPRPSHSP